MTFTRFALDKSTPSLWRVTFSNPPINLIDYTMIRELSQLLADIEENGEPTVLVFESADRDYFLAHYDIAGDHSLVNSQKGPTGFHPWIDVLVRLSKLPAVTISAIRGRARGAGSEFVLACDIRFASLERAVLGHMEVGFATIPGGGPATRLPGLVGRGRTWIHIEGPRMAKSIDDDHRTGKTVASGRRRIDGRARDSYPLRGPRPSAEPRVMAPWQRDDCDPLSARSAAQAGAAGAGS
jgi:enoyl-CoA hydratase/carnithine racemase